MIKIENTEVVGWEHAIRGMRNPMNSWKNSDSEYKYYFDECEGADKGIYRYTLGTNDLDLMTRLRNAGTDHRKFMRMITVYLDVTAPLYWWKEYDTYKVGTVANSCSTMHKVTAKQFDLQDFSHEHLTIASSVALQEVIYHLNYWWAKYDTAETDEIKKECWWQIIQMLPSSYNQRRTVMLNYEVLANIYRQRKGHKLDEWRTFCKWVKQLPYSELITGKEA